MPTIEVALAAFLGIALTVSILSRWLRTPYTILLVLAGVALTLSSVDTLTGVDVVFTQLIGAGLFVGLVLPPLLFESMMSIRVEEFRAVARPAFLLATAGVAIATVAGGLMIWRFAGLAPYPAFLFAALIAPTDVATVLEIFKRAKVPSRLATLMETEAAFNDAAGIAIFSIILTSFGATRLALLPAVANFLVVFGGGILVGLIVSFIARQVQRGVSDTVSVALLTMTAVYGAYGLATILGVSGLVAVAITGLYYGNAVMLGGERDEAAVSTRSFWMVLAFIANTVAFLFIGVSTNPGSLSGSLLAIGIAFSVVFAARFGLVQFILGIKAVAGSKFSREWRNVAVLGGMRGALSLALVSTVPSDFPSRDVIVAMTFGVAIISIMVQGPVLMRYVSRAFGRQATLTDEGAVAERQQ